MVHIRAARKDEVKDLQNLNNEVFIADQQYDPDLLMDWAQSNKGKEYFTQLLNDQNSCCLIAEDNGRKVGYIAAAPKDIRYRKSKYIEIEDMGVTPQYRSKGIGTMLIDECLKWAKSKGFQKAYVNSYFDNLKAIKFYKKNGFSEIDICLEKFL
ncbi:MAG: GNAT family N-acetyltransferase [bacterium]|nr:GNAT family N-acetyltransferase [bacterium]